MKKERKEKGEFGVAMVNSETGKVEQPDPTSGPAVPEQDRMRRDKPESEAIQVALIRADGIKHLKSSITGIGEGLAIGGVAIAVGLVLHGCMGM